MILPENANYRFYGYVEDLTGITEAVLNLPDEVWTQYRRNSDMHELNADVDSIVLRHGIKEDSPVYRNTEAYDCLKDALKPVLSVLPGADRIRLAKLKAGGKIPPHVDAASYFKLMHRLHIPLTTNPDVWFFIRGEGWRLLPGEIWEINNVVEHSVVNDGDTDRIHLVVDYFDI